MSSSTRVARAKSAFQFYQSERLSIVKTQLGANGTMGAAMTELSTQWRALSDEARRPYLELEAEDKIRFEGESRIADEEALAASEQRRNDHTVVEEGSSRGCRARLEEERLMEEERKRKRREELEAELSESELEERNRIRAEKKRETEERRRSKAEEQRKLDERHAKLNRSQKAAANKRLEYLLKQSSVFSKLRMNTHESACNEERDKSTEVSHRKSSKKNDSEVDSQDEVDLDDEEEYTFLSSQPKCIKFGTLKPYQIESLNWMIHLMAKGLNGILADEMGLGKTLQSISILAYCYEYLNIQGPHIVVVPKSTLSNWVKEFSRWFPAIRVIKFHGTRDEREFMKADCFTTAAATHDGKRPERKLDDGITDDNSQNPRQWDVCLTTYEVCNTERKTLEKFAWKYLVIDEAHRLKNEASQFSKTVRGFRTQHRLLLTGTPLQNNLHELWALLNFLVPDIFADSDQFDEWFNLEIDDDETKKNMIEQLHHILRPFMLRRLKKEVAKGLPPKTETLLMVGMSKMQKQLYKKLLLRDIDSLTAKGTQKGKTAILNIVMQLRKCCGHPYLFEGVEDRSLDPLGEHLIENCGKLVVVDKLLKRLKSLGHRVLIFTQMTRILDILEDYMHIRGYQYCRIDGNTEYVDREHAIDSFNAEGSEKFVFLLSTRAGGLGINLQTADTCILYDSDWNPQADLQAQDRCHRIGQKNPVQVYRLVTENTVEEKIVERAQQKLKLDAMVVQQGRLKEKDKLSSDEIMAAVRFGADVVFRSEESTISDDDIDAIIARGKARTEEMNNKLQEAEKGDLLDFRMDGGISAQTFEGVDYSDQNLRDQLKLLAADSMGKRERKAPTSTYSNIIPSKKTMVVNNRRIKLPKSLRLPRMEDFQFFNRERLMELGSIEFQNYAALRERNLLPPKSYIENARTILPPELAQEKLDLLGEGFADWTRAQYYHFIKASTKYGRADLQSIAAEMDLPIELVTNYSAAFWQFGPTELKADEWERANGSIVRGEQKIAKRQNLSKLLEQFIGSFKDPRNDIVFANKGTAHFALEQDRALLAAVSDLGYGNWDSVRESIKKDERLLFHHTTLGMDVDNITKRCDYRIRQMEKELEAREKKLKLEKSAAVYTAEKILTTSLEVDHYEKQVIRNELLGLPPPSLAILSDAARENYEERVNERQPMIDRLREIEIQVRNCRILADQTKKSILKGAQYVNYSNITLKSGGSVKGLAYDANSAKRKPPGPVPKAENKIKQEQQPLLEDTEAKHHSTIMKVKECGSCQFCLDKPSRDGPYVLRRPCIKRQEMRRKLFGSEGLIFVADLVTIKNEMKLEDNNDDSVVCSRASTPVNHSKKISVVDNEQQTFTSPSFNDANDVSSIAGSIKSNGSIQKLSSIAAPRRVTSLGNKRMSVTDEILPDLCRRIGIQGTNKRMELINQFALDYPDSSVRQVTIKFGEVTVKKRPECVNERPKEPIKRRGKGGIFYLRPRMYHLLPADEQPQCDWQKYADDDENIWEEEQRVEREKMQKIKMEQQRTKKRRRSSKDTSSLAESNEYNGSGLLSATASVVAEPLHSEDEHVDKRAKVT